MPPYAVMFRLDAAMGSNYHNSSCVYFYNKHQLPAGRWPGPNPSGVLRARPTLLKASMSGWTPSWAHIIAMRCVHLTLKAAVSGWTLAWVHIIAFPRVRII